MEKLNILMVDDQPAKLLTYEAMLGAARREPDQGADGARGAGASAAATTSRSC